MRHVHYHHYRIPITGILAFNRQKMPKNWTLRIDHPENIIETGNIWQSWFTKFAGFFPLLSVKKQLHYYHQLLLLTPASGIPWRSSPPVTSVTSAAGRSRSPGCLRPSPAALRSLRSLGDRGSSGATVDSVDHGLLGGWRREISREQPSMTGINMISRHKYHICRNMACLDTFGKILGKCWESRQAWSPSVGTVSRSFLLIIRRNVYRGSHQQASKINHRKSAGNIIMLKLSKSCFEEKWSGTSWGLHVWSFPVLNHQLWSCGFWATRIYPMTIAGQWLQPIPERFINFK